jgi:hypothetical protein
MPGSAFFGSSPIQKQSNLRTSPVVSPTESGTALGFELDLNPWTKCNDVRRQAAIKERALVANSATL